MALSREDKADVKGAMGKAIANKVAKVTNDSYKPSKKSWMDGLDKTKYSPEKIARWKADERRAKSDMVRLQANPFKNHPDTSPARMAYRDTQNAKEIALSKKK